MKYCVLTLARVHNGDLNNLIDNLNKYFVENNNNIDLLVFVEKKDLVCISNCKQYKGGNVVFHTIDDLSKVNSYNAELSEKVYGFNIQYRSMCRFFSGELFKILKQYNYTHYLRLDTDSSFTESVRNLFEEFTNLNMSYGYITILNEPPEVSLSLTNEVKKYLQHNENVQKFILRDHLDQLNFIYYNNFEMVKIEDFIIDEHINLYNYLDNTNGFMKYRWGDALFRFIYVNLFIPQDKIYYFANIGYHHKFYLKNQPFKFIDWDIDNYRLQNTLK